MTVPVVISDGELRPATNGREDRMVADPRRAAQRGVDLRHRAAGIRLALRELQQCALTPGWERQLLQVAAAGAVALRTYSAGSM